MDGLLENLFFISWRVEWSYVCTFSCFNLGYHFCLISFWDFMDLYPSLSNALSLSAYINITLLYLYNINWIALYCSVYSHQGSSIFTFKREVNRSTACRCSCQSTGEPPPPKTANLCEWYHSSIESNMTLCQMLEGFPFISMYEHTVLGWSRVAKLPMTFSLLSICFIESRG